MTEEHLMKFLKANLGKFVTVPNKGDKMKFIKATLSADKKLAYFETTSMIIQEYTKEDSDYGDPKSLITYGFAVADECWLVEESPEELLKQLKPIFIIPSPDENA